MARSRRKLGDILVGWGVMTAAQAEQASQLAKGSGKPLDEINALMKQFEQMKQMMKMMNKMPMGGARMPGIRR